LRTCEEGNSAVADEERRRKTKRMVLKRIILFILTADDAGVFKHFFYDVKIFIVPGVIK